MVSPDDLARIRIRFRLALPALNRSPHCGHSISYQLTRLISAGVISWPHFGHGLFREERESGRREITDFRRSVASLAAIYKQHISIDDELIFPMASRMLSAREKQEVANEMARRRKGRLITDLSGSRT